MGSVKCRALSDVSVIEFHRTHVYGIDSLLKHSVESGVEAAFLAIQF